MSISELRIGINAYFEAHQFIKKHGLWIYVLLPGLINLFLLVSFLAAVFPLTSKLAGRLEMLMAFDNWLGTVLYYFMSILMKVIAFLFYFMIYKSLVLILMSPLLALLSEKTDKIRRGIEYPFAWRKFLSDVMRGIAISIRNLSLEVFFTLILWLFSMVPVIGLAGPVLIFLVQSYYFGFSMLDYSNEREGMNYRESVRFIRSHRTMAIAGGAIFHGLFLIPIAGWMIAPAYGVVAATIASEKVRSVPLTV